MSYVKTSILGFLGSILAFLKEFQLKFGKTVAFLTVINTFLYEYFIYKKWNLVSKKLSDSIDSIGSLDNICSYKGENMADEKKPKPAPKTRYGPTFDEIERRDPVQWHAAHRAWVRYSILIFAKKLLIFLNYFFIGIPYINKEVLGFLAV